MQIHRFSFVGYQGYDEIVPKIDALLQEAFGYENYPYQIAINEAVCNAARHSIQGLTKANIRMRVRISPVDIATTVYSRSRTFDAHAWQKRLRKLLEDERTRNLDWGVFVGAEDESRGIWYMLTGTDYLYYEKNGQSVTLVARTNDGRREHLSKIELLVPRFFVKENGVIT